MSQSEGYDINRSVDELLRFSADQLKSISRIRLIGYGLLLLALFDFFQTVIPPQFMNAAWELQTMGALMERIPVPLLGLGLVFFGEDYNRGGLESLLVKILSWLSLLLAILCFLLVPLGIVDSVRVNNQNTQEIAAQADRQLAQLEQIEQQVGGGSQADLQNLATELNRLGLPVDTTNPEQLRGEVLARIPQAREQVQQQARQLQSNRRLALLESSTKWILAAIISAVLFLMIWRGTAWAR
jgi:hypothetical protein